MRVLSLISSSVVRTLVCALLTLSLTSVHAQPDSPGELTVRTTNSDQTEADLLKWAQSFRDSDQQTSENLAKELLRLPDNNKNHRIRAQAHTLLGELAAKSQRIDSSKQHFLEASRIYKDLDDTQFYILSLVEYAALFFEEEGEYDEGFNIIDELMLLAYAHGEDLPIASVLTTQGHAHYDQRDYNKAVTAFENAFNYMSGKDKDTQIHLGLTYHQTGQAYKQLKLREKSALFHKKALEVFVSLQDEELIARALKNVGIAENNLDNPLIALEYLIRSLEIHNKLNNPDEHAEVLKIGGVIYRGLGRYETSLEYVNEAYLMYKALGDIANTAETSNQIGHLYKNLGQDEQARSFYQLSVDLPEDQIAPKTLASALRELAILDFKAGKYDSAMESAQKAFNIGDNINDKLKNSATARIIGDIHQAQGNNSESLRLYRQALSLADESGSEAVQVKALNTLGRALIGINNNEATTLLRKSLDIATEANILNDKLATYISLRKAEKLQGNFTEALRLAEQEISLSKTLNEVKERNDFIRAVAVLDSHKMELELQVLRKKVEFDELELIQKNNEIEIVRQSNQISELELTKNKYANTLLATLLLICILVVIYIYRISVATKKRNKELDYLAARDPLTNCYNRRIMSDLINRDFADLEQLGEYSIIMVDIDHFKQVNDTYGHSAGDAVLRGVANILQASVRRDDIVSRYGGEEFCIIFPDASLEQAMAIAETIRKKVKNSLFNDITVTCSFGVSSIKFGAKVPAELIDQADTALYRSKAYGRNRVTAWNTKQGNIDKNETIIV